MDYYTRALSQAHINKQLLNFSEWLNVPISSGTNVAIHVNSFVIVFYVEPWETGSLCFGFLTQYQR